MNIDTQYQPASLTKIMTMLMVLIESDKDSNLLSTTITINQTTSNEKNGTNACLELGDVFTIEELLYALMLPSGNDAALAIAD